MDYREVIYLGSELAKNIKELKSLDIANDEEVERLDREIKRLRAKVVNYFPQYREMARSQGLIMRNEDATAEVLDERRYLAIDFMEDVASEINHLPKY